METSDRGMLDIERFDLEPDRPILHGLVGNVTSDQVNTLSPPARLGLVLQIAGLHTISPRLAASLLELNLTLKGFSQLGSDVTLGGATTTTAVRRLALGMPLASGRVYIDVSGQLAEVTSPPLPDLSHPRRLRETAEVRELVQYAIMAPSHGNDQPWRFEYGDGVLRVLHDTERGGGGRDEIGRHWALVAIGGALANCRSRPGSKVAKPTFSCSRPNKTRPWSRRCDSDCAPADRPTTPYSRRSRGETPTVASGPVRTCRRSMCKRCRQPPATAGPSCNYVRTARCSANSGN
ncbi:hypothetical protein [Nannocystis pusilla]|uniref:hypothetical protein n=1 Tax=Nannocystis pusilla TaxID=889268 RepID=UPI003B7EB4EE